MSVAPKEPRRRSGTAYGTARVFENNAYLYLRVHAGIITTRSANRIDVEYFKYLPFTEVFSSNDRLHATLFPVFAHRRQDFVSGSALKSALREMVDHYDALPEEEKSRGSMTYADYPLVHIDNAVTKLFDKRFPKWRDGANLPRPPRDESADAELLADLKGRSEWLERHAK